MSEENKKRGRGRPKKKEVEEEEISEESNAGNAEEDDSFGLPSFELQQLEEEDVSENAGDEEQVAFNEEDQFEEPVDAMDESEENDEIKQSTGYKQEKASYHRKYEYKEEKSTAPKIIVGIIGVLMIVAGIYYFGFYKPEQKAAAEVAEQQAAAAQKSADNAARQRQLDQERIAREQAAAAALEVPEDSKPIPGIINIITEPTGRYYVVVNSFVDEDLAMDYGETLAEQGIGSMILGPGPGKFHRLALSDHESWNEAQVEADNMKSEYSDELWVLKY